MKILKFLKDRIDNSYIVNFIDSGEGEVKRIGHRITKNRYLILGYEKKGCLFDYIYFPKSGFPEEYSKVIFYKILMGLKAIHNQKICHLDIKLENILVDEKYNPKICDFGFSTYNKNDLKKYLGTKGFRSPQILNNTPYNGFKNDIFSLGQTLMFLVAGHPGYEDDADEDNLLYDFIKNKNKYYWEILKKAKFKELTQEFKELYFDLLTYSEEYRPEIETILKSKWMKDIQSKIKDLESKIIEEFERREKIIIEKKATKVEIKEKSSELGGTMRSLGDNENDFNYNSRPYDIKNEKHFDNFIIINTVLHPSTLMNELKNKLLINYGKKCDIIIRNVKKLKLNISFDKEKGKTEEIFEKMREELKKLNINEIKFENKNEKNDENKNNKEKGEVEEDEEEENYDNIIDEEKSIIDAKLFLIKDNEYLLSFIKKEGGLEEFYNNIQKITEQVKNIN